MIRDRLYTGWRKENSTKSRGVINPCGEAVSNERYPSPNACSSAHSNDVPAFLKIW